MANLELMEREQIVDRLAPRIEQLRAGLIPHADWPQVAIVRQQSMMVGIELIKNKGRDEPFTAELRLGHRVIMAWRESGLIIRPLGYTIVLMPPLASTEREITHMLDGVTWAIRHITKPLM